MWSARNVVTSRYAAAAATAGRCSSFTTARTSLSTSECNMWRAGSNEALVWESAMQAGAVRRPFSSLPSDERVQPVLNRRRSADTTSGEAVRRKSQSAAPSMQEPIENRPAPTSKARPKKRKGSAAARRSGAAAATTSAGRLVPPPAPVSRDTFSQPPPTYAEDVEAKAAASNSVAAASSDPVAREEDDLESFVQLLQEEAAQREQRLLAEKERILSASASAQHGRDTDTPSASSVEVDSLTEEQARAVKLALNGANVFITGGAGTGKSLVLREIVLQLRAQRGKGSRVYMTATTGVAAVNVRGTTLNSFSGVGFAQGSKEDVLKNVRKSRKAAGRIAYCESLIIDEVSMLDVELLDKLSYVCQKIRKRPDEPFGGIQVILCGDFMQLPPIDSSRFGKRSFGRDRKVKDISALLAETGSASDGVKKQYCFQTDAWKSLDLNTVVLHRQHRQGKDTAFQRVLDEARMGCLSDNSLALLRARTETGAQDAEESASGGKHYVRLCGTNKEVDARNAKYFAELAPQTEINDVTTVVRNASVVMDGEDDTEDPLRPMHVFSAYDVLLNTNANGQGGTIVLPQHKSGGGSNGDNFERKTYGSAGSGGGGAGGSGSGAGGGISSMSSGVRFEDSSLSTVLPLKVGTRVMLTSNISTRLSLVNGSVGEVTGFLHPLEYVDLVLRAGRERRLAQPTERGRCLLTRGGFGNFFDAMRCVDTSHAQTLFGWLRQRQASTGSKSSMQVDDFSYGHVYGADHLANVLRLVGLDEVATADGDIISASRVGDENENESDAGRGGEGYSEDAEGLGLLEELLVNSSLSHGAGGNIGVEADELYLGGLLPLHMRMMRLPVVRFDLDLNTTSAATDSNKASLHANTLSNKSRRVVYAFVSPVQQHWYMGTKAVASRTQLPLRHAWAITVHKAQGLTISQLQVDMGRFYTPGQAYVALSRATALDNVKLFNFSAESVRTCAVARAMYEELESSQR